MTSSKSFLTVAVTYYDRSEPFLSHRFHLRITLKSSLRANWLKLVKIAQTCSNWIKPVPNQSSLNKSRIYISAFELIFLIKVHRQGYSSTLGRIVSRWEIKIPSDDYNPLLGCPSFFAAPMALLK